MPVASFANSSAPKTNFFARFPTFPEVGFLDLGVQQRPEAQLRAAWCMGDSPNRAKYYPCSFLWLSRRNIIEPFVRHGREIVKTHADHGGHDLVVRSGTIAVCGAKCRIEVAV